MQSNGTDPESPLVDAEMLGRLLRAARIVAGYERVHDAAQAIRDTTGVHMTHRTLYALERGEQKATLEYFCAALLTYRPPSGQRFFLGALRDDLVEMISDQ